MNPQAADIANPYIPKVLTISYLAFSTQVVIQCTKASLEADYKALLQVLLAAVAMLHSIEHDVPMSLGLGLQRNF